MSSNNQSILWTETLLKNDINEEERYQTAQVIINNYNLFLNVEQILIAFQKIREYIKSVIYRKNIAYNNRLFLMSKLLDQNINLYTAIILALNSDFSPSSLYFLIVFNHGEPDTIGVAIYCVGNAFIELLNYYDFSIDDFQISDKIKQKIIEHRNKIYGGRSIKSAVKN